MLLCAIVLCTENEKKKKMHMDLQMAGKTHICLFTSKNCLLNNQAMNCISYQDY